MERTTTGSQLTAHPFPLHIGFATEADEADLRRMLRETPVGGAVQLSFEREPNYFASVRREGLRHYTVLARDAGKIVAMASRTVWPTGVGYLHQLRIALSHRHLTRQFLRLGFRMLRETRAPEEAPYDVTTIVADNTVARRVLEAGLPGLPIYRPVATIVTLLLPARSGFGVCDLRAHKQVVVRGYRPSLARWRWLLRLPAVGTVLPIAYVTPGGEPPPADCRWLVLALPATDPRVTELRRQYRPRTYESLLYVVHEPGTPVADVNPHWEVAWL
jgi:hypothetical protein